MICQQTKRILLLNPSAYPFWHKMRPMTAGSVWKISIHILSMMMMGICILTASGCLNLFSLKKEVNPNNAHASLLKRGNDAFQNQEYEKALELYERVSHLAEDPVIRRKAIYGMVCTRFLLANTAEEFDEAVALWDTWSGMLPENLSGEDPRMLQPVLMQKTIPVVSDNKPQEEAGRYIHKISINELKNKEDEIRRLRRQLKAREEEINKLKHQISSLEAIDRKIQEKKEEIASP